MTAITRFLSLLLVWFILFSPPASARIVFLLEGQGAFNSERWKIPGYVLYEILSSARLEEQLQGRCHRLLNKGCPFQPDADIGPSARYVIRKTPILNKIMNERRLRAVLEPPGYFYEYYEERYDDTASYLIAKVSAQVDNPFTEPPFHHYGPNLSAPYVSSLKFR